MIRASSLSPKRSAVRPVCCVVPLAVVLTACPAFAQQGGNPVPVKAAAVSQRPIAAGLAFVGTTTPVRRSVVGSAVAGRIVEFRHNEGDYVEEGEVLAQVLTGTIEIELAQARAELKVREAELQESVKSFPAEQEMADARLQAAKAKRDHAAAKHERMLELRKQRSASDEALDEAESAALETKAVFFEADAARAMIFDGAREQRIRRLEAQVAAQREAVELIEDRLSKYTIKAYFSGYVTAEHTEVGHWIKDGEPVAEIAEMEYVDVRVNVPEDHVSELQVGDSVRVEVNATRQKSFLGEVAAIVPQADLKARTFPVLVRIRNPLRPPPEGSPAPASPEIKSGMLARAMLPVGKRKEALMVSKDAIVYGQRSPIVFAIDRSGDQGNVGAVRVVPVELGIAVGGEIEVANLVPDNPLRAGDLVVVEGNERLRPGQPVAYSPRVARTDAPAGN